MRSKPTGSSLRARQSRVLVLWVLCGLAAGTYQPRLTFAQAQPPGTTPTSQPAPATTPTSQPAPAATPASSAPAATPAPSATPATQPTATQPTAAGAAGATAPGQPSEAQIQFEAGVDALQARNYERAAELFNKSYALEQQAATLYNLGIAYQAQRSPALAVEAWEAYVAMADPQKDAQTIDAVKREIARVTGLMARFTLTVEPADASIQIDGEEARRFKNELWVQPGSRHISVSAPGYEDYEQSLVVQAGRFSLDIKLRKPQGPPQVVAAQLLTEGEQLVEGGNLQAGVEKLERAHELNPNPHTAGALGLAAESLGRLGQAAEMVEEALTDRNDPWVRKHKRKLRLARRRLVGKTATLYVEGADYPGAEIVVNGRSVGKLPLPDGGKMLIGEGSLSVKAHLTGYDSYAQEVDVKARQEVRVTVIMYKSKPVPVTLVLVPISTWPNPPAPVAVAAAPVAVQPPPETPEPEEEGPSQSDIEAMAQLELGEPPDEHEDVRGVELSSDFGYQFWMGDGLSESKGGFATRLFSIGYRPFWLVSFGIQLIGGQFDLPGDERKVVASATAGALYLRLHSQMKRKALTPDFWLGTGYEPFSMSLTVYEANDLSLADANREQAGQVVQNQLGVGDTVTLQTTNVPLDFGVTFYLTESFGLSVVGQYKWWIPSQECFHDASDRICYESDLDTLSSFYVGGGLSFLP